MRYSKSLISAIAILCLIPCTFSQNSLQTENVNVKASLDLLVSRISEYWKLMATGKKLQAEEFIVESDREQFRNNSTPSFSKPRLKSLEFSDDKTRVFVTVTISRVTYPTGRMDWPVVGEWTFEKNSWYYNLPSPTLPMFTGRKKPKTTLSADKIEAETRKLKEILRFKNTVLDFGNIRQESRVDVKIKYSLEGTEPVYVTLNAPSGTMLRGLENQSLVPGKDRELTLWMPVLDYDGSVNEHIFIVAHRNRVQVPFEITLKGFVQVPISALPRFLRFNFKKGETEKEVVVRNNTNSAVELKSLSKESDLLTVEPLPATVPPGKQLTLKIRQVRDVSKINDIRSLEIVLAEPVENKKSLIVTAILNVPENPAAAPPAITPEIQQLIRKNQMQIPER